LHHGRAGVAFAEPRDAASRVKAMTPTDPAFYIGLITMAVLGYGLALLMLWRQPKAIKWFAIALVTIALGYLSVMGVPVTVAKAVYGRPM
jgi:hypothetical protein